VPRFGFSRAAAASPGAHSAAADLTCEGNYGKLFGNWSISLFLVQKKQVMALFYMVNNENENEY
jgi:hypothetical protein